MNHDDIQSLLGAYALDAVDADEAAEIEAHLTECPRCRSEVAAHRNTASLLARVGGEAPAGTWDHIAAQLGRDDRADDEPSADHEPLLESSNVARPSNVVPLPVWRRVALPVVATVAGAAAAAAVILGVSAVRLDHRVNDLSNALGAGGLHQAAAAAVLSPQHQNVQLRSPSNEPRAQVVTLPDGNAYLVGSQLPALDSVRTYQLWGLVNGKAVSLGLLGSNPQVAAFRVDPRVSRLMITAEPKGGVPQPTTPVLAQGDLTA